MDYYSYQQHSHSSGGNFGSKEKRPPLKRGQLKRQIVRTISSLVAPRNAESASAREKADRGSGFSREPSYN
ncbi:hypothetical protein SETIT_3G212700v2 [Setaria italica]|uniref:Uncharacterized protein n=2 Tax=Setaria TaxID=4554 RepID=K3ZF78_SETIT|nr:hypothetical protein SETIT_3G212700v2 [Setaria italica]TKW26831.1 hypothetical protein SEVIR_3G217200v2 [Setaria viridis]